VFFYILYIKTSGFFKPFPNYFLKVFLNLSFSKKNFRKGLAPEKKKRLWIIKFGFCLGLRGFLFGLGLILSCHSRRQAGNPVSKYPGCLPAQA
jgi:uncharacterized membrane protein YfcA